MASRSHKTVKPEHYYIPVSTQQAFPSIINLIVDTILVGSANITGQRWHLNPCCH